MRALIQSYAVLAIPMAVAIEKLFSSLWSKIVGIITILLFTILNQFQDWQYRNKIFLQDEITSTFYWKSFFKTELNKDFRKYIDAEEIYTGPNNTNPIKELEVFKSDSELVPIDTILPGQFSETIRIPITEFLASGSYWLKISAEVLMRSDQFNNHDQARLVTAIKRGDENLKWVGVRFQRMMDINKWDTIFYDFNIPKLDIKDKYVEVTVWNNGPDIILMQSLRIEGYR